MELQKIDFTRYTDKQLEQFISMSWSLIFHLATAYDKPIGSLNLDFIVLLDECMQQAGKVLWDRQYCK